MKRLKNLLILSCVCLGTGHAWAQRALSFDIDNPEQRKEAVQQMRQASEARKAEAWAKARSQGWKIRGENDKGATYELVELDAKGKPVYKITENSNAAISTAASFIRNTVPFNLTGSGVKAGVWDSGSVRSDHQEFDTRVSVKDSASSAGHSTHVGGTIAGAGIVASARGMAPEASIDSYEWNNDTAEMISAAATGQGQTTKLYLSNHSYGNVTGWDLGNYSGSYGNHFWGDYPAEREDDDFGRYGIDAPDWDSLTYDAEYFLPFKSAGNDRNDSAPSSGQTFYYNDNGSWRTEVYNPATGPYADNYDNGGYDSIPAVGVAKNIMTVGAVDDAVSSGLRDLSYIDETLSFSSWGPADDGRIKPDIVANGGSLYSADNTSTNAYSTRSGTSMASPNAAGSAVLLIEYYQNHFPGQSMRASTLKGLILHTADDLGNPGPDYQFGWGLMNAKAAADHIRIHKSSPTTNRMVEGLLNSSNTSDTFTIKWDGASPIKATLCWTDPPHATVTGLDNTTRILINDLDLQITAPDGSTTYFPYTLDPANPSANAQTGDNVLDNVEQVYLASPSQLGVYTVTVSYKSSLTNGQQRYSLLLSGQAEDDLLVLPAVDFLSRGEPGGPFSPLTQSFTLTNTGSTAIDWTASRVETWVDLSDSSGTLPAGQSMTITASINGGADTFASSSTPYTAEVVFTNTNSGATQIRSVFLTVATDYFTELFSENNDLNHTAITFTADGSGGFASACKQQVFGFYTNPTDGTVLTLSDESSTQINLNNGAIFPFFGQNYSSFYVGSNGYITFTGGDDSYEETLDLHFNQLRISALFNDFDPGAGGEISWKQTSDRVAVTYRDVPEWDTNNLNNLQVEMFFDGTVRLTLLDIDAVSGVTGLSGGGGIPSDFVNSNLSSYPSCLTQTSVGDHWQDYR